MITGYDCNCIYRVVQRKYFAVIFNNKKESTKKIRITKAIIIGMFVFVFTNIYYYLVVNIYPSFLSKCYIFFFKFILVAFLFKS